MQLIGDLLFGAVVVEIDPQRVQEVASFYPVVIDDRTEVVSDEGREVLVDAGMKEKLIHPQVLIKEEAGLPPSDREHLMGFPERCGSLEQVVAEAADTHQWLQVPRVLLAEVVDLLTCVPQAASFRGMGSLVEGDDGQAGVLHGDKGAEALFFKCGSNHEGNL